MPEVVYESEWGEIIRRNHVGEIRWFDSTEHMTGEQFNRFLEEYAACIETLERPGAFVDAVQFRMPMPRMSESWRDEHIVPRYNRAGLRAFAFLMPQGMPAIGAEPKREGPGEYLTGYFAARKEAFAFLDIH